jgi:phosphopantothenoylcysteine decarboxylase/phosphopantothenate--cysteine ligase
MYLLNKHIILGISGGIAAYKTPELVRLFIKEGAQVQVVMTQAATHFVTPTTLQAVSGNPVFISQWDDRIPNGMAHIELSRKADAIVIAPASADLMAKHSLGLADDLLSTLLIARGFEEQGSILPLSLIHI